MRDMFKLYKFENRLCTMRLTGQEIKDYLEMSYTLWTNQMVYPSDSILKLKRGHGRMWLANLAYNFDSAAGIKYSVDVTQRNKHKITIHSMSDGSPFSLSRDYLVVTNSYRSNWGV